MSLIAEALRKSEAERRRGQVPSLVSLEDWTPRPRQRDSRRGASFVAGAAVALLAMAAAAWWFLPSLRDRLAGTPPGPADAPAVPSVPANVPGAAAPATTTPAPLPTVDARPSDRVTRVDVVSSAPHAQEPVAPVASRPPGDASIPASPGPATAPTPSPAAATPPAVAVVPIPPLSEPPARSPAPPSPFERSTTPTTTPAAPVEPVASLPVEPATAAVHVPSIVELPDSQRAALPALKLNMHVYAKDPANRFVLVNGNRLAEGESGSDGVRVVEIRPDGVVVDAKSVRVFLPRG